MTNSSTTPAKKGSKAMTSREIFPTVPLAAASRRSVIKTIAVVGLASPFVNRLVRPARAAGTGVVNYAGYGGNYGKALKEVYFDPFEKETGIRVNSGVGAGLPLAKLQVMNPNGAEWDIVDL